MCHILPTTISLNNYSLSPFPIYLQKKDQLLTEPSGVIFTKLIVRKKKLPDPQQNKNKNDIPQIGDGPRILNENKPGFLHGLSSFLMLSKSNS